MPEAPEDAAKESKHAADVAVGKSQAAEEQVGIVLIGRVHVGRGIACGLHRFFDKVSEVVELGGGGWCGGAFPGFRRAGMS